MHNFPKDLCFICNKDLTEGEYKEICKLAITNEISLEFLSPPYKPSKSEPKLLYNDNNLENTGMNSKDADEYYIFINFQDFKKFLKGEGDIKSLPIPFNEKVILNKNRTAEVKKTKVIVGCEEFTHEKITELYKASQKAQKSKY